MNFWAISQGFTVSLSMIVPIGAQNAYVINQGILRKYHFMTAMLCSLLDVLFIFLGVYWGGSAIANYDALIIVVNLLGIAFLSVYGTQSLISAFRGNDDSQISSSGVVMKRSVILGALAVTLLNPGQPNEWV